VYKRQAQQVKELIHSYISWLLATGKVGQFTVMPRDAHATPR
jgi:hypothetical protein